ncbi:MAG TPA: efflux RND transporter periplasmic adaptor subunit [Alphaproteobacteria bacterium]|nr:efflux RND transporter periplasmic adaptor subunit [Alphaproteobacteria bacterium]
MAKGLFVIVCAAALGGWLVWSGKLPFSVPTEPTAAEAAIPDAGGMPQAMPVSVAAAVGADITRWNEFSGRLSAVEDVEVRPRVSGMVDEVHFREGDLVKKDDKLFSIDIRPFQAAYDRAAAALAAAEARVTLTGSELGRAKRLLEERALSQRELDEKNNAHLEAVAAVQGAEAEVQLARLDLEYAEVRSPITGRVGRLDITVGNIVQAGQSVLTTLQSVDPVYADFDIDEQTYLRVIKAMRGGDQETSARNMKVFMALADETEFTREGSIRSFDNRLIADSGTLRVRAEFKNPDGILTPGLFARLRLGSAETQAAVLINDAAIGTDQTRKFVYVVDGEGNVQYRPVSPGKLSADGLRIIEGGLQAGENIVVNGLQRVHPGMKVQPMMVSMTTLKPEGAADGAPPAAPEGMPPAPTEEAPQPE